jgi:hypothetical protein
VVAYRARARRDESQKGHSAFEHGNLPMVAALVVSKDERRTISDSNPEIAVVFTRPAIDDLFHVDHCATVTEAKGQRSAMIAATFDPNHLHCTLLHDIEDFSFRGGGVRVEVIIAQAMGFLARVLAPGGSAAVRMEEARLPAGPISAAFAHREQTGESDCRLQPTSKGQLPAAAQISAVTNSRVRRRRAQVHRLPKLRRPRGCPLRAST